MLKATGFWNSRPHFAAIAGLVTASVLWGASFALAKLALQELSVRQLILCRFLLASAAVLPILLLRKRLPSRKDLPLFALTGFLMVPVTYLLQYAGLQLTDSASASLMVGAEAPMLALCGTLFESERLGRRGWSAVAVSSLGVAVLVGLPSHGSHWLGDLLILISMVVVTFWVMTSKRLSGRYSAFDATGWIVVFGTASLLPFALLDSSWAPQALPSLHTALPLLGLGLGCTVVSFVLWNFGVARMGAGKAGVLLNLEPAVGAVLGISLLGDALGWGTVLGGLLILTAAVLVSWPDRLTSTRSKRRCRTSDVFASAVQSSQGG